MNSMRRVLPVTMGDKAYVEMHGTFLTDHQYMGVMHQTVAHMYETCLRNLQSYMSRVGPLLQNSGGSTSVSGSRAMGHMVPAGILACISCMHVIHAVVQ